MPSPRVAIPLPTQEPSKPSEASPTVEPAQPSVNSPNESGAVGPETPTELHRDIKRLISLLEMHREEKTAEQPVVVRVERGDFDIASLSDLRSVRSLLHLVAEGDSEDEDEPIQERSQRIDPRKRVKDLAKREEKAGEESYMSFFVFTALLIGVAYAIYSFYSYERTRYHAPIYHRRF